MAIGTLNEGALHQSLKRRYTTRDSSVEHEVDGFVADILDGDRIVEIQTGSFGAMKRKLPRLLERGPVTLVHPIAEVRYIVKLPRYADGAASRRKSPKRGSVFDVFAELVSIPTLLDHENLTLDVVMTKEDEVRTFDGKRGWRRGGWVVVERRLVEVLETHSVASTADLFGRVSGALDATFTTADLAAAMDRPRRVAQQAAYCFRAAGLIEICAKQGNALVYRRTG